MDSLSAVGLIFFLISVVEFENFILEVARVRVIYFSLRYSKQVYRAILTHDILIYRNVFQALDNIKRAIFLFNR